MGWDGWTKASFIIQYTHENLNIFIFTTFSWTFEPMASFFSDILASLTFADMADNGGRDDEQFIFISLRARLPNRIYIFIIYQPHLCFRLDTIEGSSFTNHYLWRHHPLSSLMRITRFHRQIFIQMEPKNILSEWKNSLYEAVETVKTHFGINFPDIT